MKLDDLTQEEYDLIMQKRNEKDKESEAQLPVKTGTLRHDLYFIEDDYRCEQWHCTKSEKDEIIQSMFSLILKKGAKFECYIENGIESWYDCANIGFECMPEYWADKHLDQILKIK